MGNHFKQITTLPIMSVIENVKSGESLTIDVISNGPYLTSNFITIIDSCHVSIVWKRYKDTIISKRPKKKDNYQYKKIYDTIDLGKHSIDKNTIIDMKNKFNHNSKSPPRALSINNKLINGDNGGTSSDIYILTFVTGTTYIKNSDVWVDH